MKKTILFMLLAIAANAADMVVNGTITGNGSGITNLSATNLVGTIPSGVMTNSLNGLAVRLGSGSVVTNLTVVTNSASGNVSLNMGGGNVTNVNTITVGSDYKWLNSGTTTLDSSASSSSAWWRILTTSGGNIATFHEVGSSGALAVGTFSPVESAVLTVSGYTYLGGSLKVTGNLTNSGNITATNGFVLPLNATPPAIGGNGAQIFSDGTNLCVVLQNAGGTKSTNRLSMTAYP